MWLILPCSNISVSVKKQCEMLSLHADYLKCYLVVFLLFPRFEVVTANIYYVLGKVVPDGIVLQ